MFPCTHQLQNSLIFQASYHYVVFTERHAAGKFVHQLFVADPPRRGFRFHAAWFHAAVEEPSNPDVFTQFEQKSSKPPRAACLLLESLRFQQGDTPSHVPPTEGFHLVFLCCCFLYFIQKFLYYVLKSSDVLDVLVPILFHLNDSRADQCNSMSFSKIE